jgi:hypothetical protein
VIEVYSSNPRRVANIVAVHGPRWADHTHHTKLCFWYHSLASQPSTSSPTPIPTHLSCSAPSFSHLPRLESRCHPLASPPAPPRIPVARPLPAAARPNPPASHPHHLSHIKLPTPVNPVLPHLKATGCDPPPTPLDRGRRW